MATSRRKNGPWAAVPSVPGDYGRYYDALYETILGGGEKLVKNEETLEQIRIISEGIRRMNML
ncbi:MAG: hypothetical protein IJQ81_13190 [Oscillibacter sp.]|nr:hypothetical protein [Oscillibacter sp.]